MQAEADDNHIIGLLQDSHHSKSYSVCRPLDVIQETWTGRLQTSSKKRSIIDYLTMTQDHLRKCVEINTENAKSFFIPSYPTLHLHFAE